jgi:hypothetical protein
VTVGNPREADAMEGSRIYQNLTEETLEEHRQIHFYLDQIHTALSTLDDVTDVEPLRRLAAQLESLKERLVEHHQIEEQGRLYPTILEVLPESRDELLKLRQQHEKMVEILELARIHAEFGKPEEAADLKADLERFLRMIREHEQAEEDLLERAIEAEEESQP